MGEKKYKLDTQKFLCQANWSHQNFGIVAAFLGSKNDEWYITEDMFEEVIEEDKPSDSE